MCGLVGDDAEDVTSDAWLEIARDLRRFRGDGAGFRGWTATIARHRALDHLRRQKRRPQTSLLELGVLELPARADTVESVLESLSTQWVTEIQGATHTVREFKPVVIRFRGAGPALGSPTQRAAQAITLGTDDVSRVNGLGRLLASAERPQTGMAFTSFGVALQKFLLSFHSYGWPEQIVDLATAFEAALSGKEKDDVTLRLKTRASPWPRRA